MLPLLFPNDETMSRHAANWLLETLGAQKSSLLCLATGGSPTGTYEFLARQLRSGAGAPWLRHLRVLKLDDWGGLAMDDPASSESYLQRYVIKPLGLEKRYFGFQSNPKHPEKECARVAKWLQHHGPIDIAVLGLGVNGHLAFNEPAAALQPHAHVAKLSKSSLQHAMVRISRTRPKFGLTLGMADLLQARRILLLVSGPTKRQPLARLLQPEITSQFPASFLWLHPRVTLLCDRAALPRFELP